jgi:hypothetical protein
MLEKIVLDLHGKKIELSIDEAKELKEILSDLFGEQKVIQVPYPYYVRPDWTVTPDWKWRRWVPGPYYTSGTTTDSTTISFSTNAE